MQRIFFSLFFAFFATKLVVGYPDDAPRNICETLDPGHHEFKPQTSRFEYVVSTTADPIEKSQKVNMVLKGPRSFKGFIVVVKDGDEPIGQFEVPDNDRNAKTFSCYKNDANTASHKNVNIKNEVPLVWKAPANFKNKELSIFVSVIEDTGIYWQNKLGGKMSVKL